MKQTPTTYHKVRFDLEGEASEILVDSNEIYISGFDANTVEVPWCYGSRGPRREGSLVAAAEPEGPVKLLPY